MRMVLGKKLWLIGTPIDLPRDATHSHVNSKSGIDDKKLWWRAVFLRPGDDLSVFYISILSPLTNSHLVTCDLQRYTMYCL